jgi:arsenate reductase
MHGAADGIRRRVLFLCTHNSARSQMAEGLLRHLKGGDWEASSAGTEPSRVHPLAAEAMREIGVDISGHRSKHLSEFDGQAFELVVTLCGGAHAACPFFAGAKEMRHRGFADPSAGGIEEFRKCRDEMMEWIMGEFPDRGGKAPPVRF